MLSFDDSSILNDYLECVACSVKHNITNTHAFPPPPLSHSFTNIHMYNNNKTFMSLFEYIGNCGSTHN